MGLRTICNVQVGTSMNKKNLLAVLACVGCTSLAWADDSKSPWVEITGSSSIQYFGKRGSGDLVNVNGKSKNAYGYVYQREDKSKKTFSYGKLFVMLDACRNGYGYVVYNDMQGNFTGQDNFVRFGGTVADGLGTEACASWDTTTGKVSRAEDGGKWELAARATQSGNEFVLKTDTFRKDVLNGKPVVTGLFGYKDVKKDRTDYNVYAMPVSDCKRGFGTIFELDFAGRQVGKSDVALDGQSMSSAVATTLCEKL